MDARELTPKFSRIERSAAVLLAAALVVGLWQGYGTWLLSAGSHVT